LDPSFDGTLTVQPDGGLELSMRDGSLILLGLGGLVKPQTIGTTDNLSLRSDLKGRVIFAADSQLFLIYTFRYKRDDSWVFMTDPKDMVSGFSFDAATGKIKEILLPSGKRIEIL
jgi:hypothetical protein